ncbi:MAG: hypothetical protein MZV64_19795 [Ignavibacteriales bacterium]|nr:hypothetical protein [Ignavibacteriales bacterium]
MASSYLVGHLSRSSSAWNRPSSPSPPVTMACASWRSRSGMGPIYTIFMRERVGSITAWCKASASPPSSSRTAWSPGTWATSNVRVSVCAS